MRSTHVLRIHGIALLVLLLICADAAAQDYSLFGTIRGRATAHVLPEADTGIVLSGKAQLSASHRLSFDSSEAVLAHRIDVLPGGDLSHTVLEGYLALYPSPSVTLYAGRQRLDWGMGYLFSPTDVLHPGSASLGFDDSAEQGFLGFASTVTLGANGTVTAAAAADDTLAPPIESPADLHVHATSGPGGNAGTPAWNTTEFWKLLTYGGNATFFVPPIDAAVSLVYRFERTFRPGVALSVGFGRGVLYAEGAVELHNGRDYPEGTPPVSLESPPLWEPFPIVAVGSEMPLTVGPADITVTAEYLYNSVGYTDEEADVVIGALGEPLSLPSVAPQFFRRHYAAASLAADLAGYVGTELAALYGLEDSSGAARGRVTLYILGGTDLWLETTGFFGAADSEFGVYPAEDQLPGRFSAAVGATLHF